MKVLIADKFEQSWHRRIGRPAARSSISRRLPTSNWRTRSRHAAPTCSSSGAPRSPKRCSTARSLSLIVRAGAGVNTIDVAAASRRGIYVSNCPGKNAIAVAELTFALILALDRRIAGQRHRSARGQVEQEGILQGEGAVRTDARHAWLRQHRTGSRAPRAARSGCRWSSGAGASTERRRPPSRDARDPDVTVARVAGGSRRTADVLSVHLALANETRGLDRRVDSNRLKPGSYFVNTSRAEIVDHAALADAVRNARHPRRRSMCSRGSRQQPPASSAIR